MFQSSVSGLQRLFSAASSSLSPHTQRGQRHLESVTEEAHTYDLLYPESDALLQGQHHAYPLRHGDPAFIAAAASSTDDRGGLDIQSPRDVRIVIAQDATSRSPQPRVLYDSHPPISLSQARNGSSSDSAQNGRQRAESFTGGLTGGGMRRNVGGRKPITAPHTRQPSLSHAANSILTSPGLPLSPVNELGGLFGNSKGRNSAARPATSDGETTQGKVAREGREETEALLECMFGAATGFPSTSSTKLHVRPPKPGDFAKENRPVSAKQESASSTAFPKRRTPLTRSTTAADLQSLSIGTAQQASRQASSAIWITRLFSVDPKESIFKFRNSDGRSLREHHHPNEAHAPPTGNSNANPAKKEKAKQLKTPTYAIAILLQMPPHRQRPLTPSSPRLSGYTADSSRSWPFDSPSTFNMPGLESNYEIDYVIAQWTVIDRALSSLEVVARCKISDALGRLDVPHLSPPVKDSLVSSESGPKLMPKKRKQPTQWTLQLPAGSLQEDSLIHDVVVGTGRRIVLALKIRKVIAGQGRWGVWREEARWVDKWAGGREQNFFFFNLLTAFVGSHTQWLDSLAPKVFRRRQAKLSEKGRKDNNAIHHRTVIVCSDKMAARRLIFLLSAFLPGAHSLSLPSGRVQSDANWSNSPGSQYPIPGGPVFRQPSLRRTLKRRPKATLANDMFMTHGRSISFSDSEIPINDNHPFENQSQGDQSRRPSDTKSVRGAALLITSDGSATRKSSTTTTATIKPEYSVPVAHFTSYPSDFPIERASGPRPSSSESLAPLALQRTLSRSESNELGNASADSQSRSGWGSLVSCWSGRRGSSTEESDPLASSEEGLGISGVPRNVHSQRSEPKLTQMVEEVTKSTIQCSRTNSTKDLNGPVFAGKSPLLESNDNKPHFGNKPLPRKIPENPVPEPFPLKLSIDENDGVIEVDLPPARSYPSSFGSVTSSPAGAHTAASSWNDQSSLYSRTPNPVTQYSSSETSGDVTGWLRNYHQDFALQAVRPYNNLVEDVKRSMRTEPAPVPLSEDDDASEWTEVCSTIIADTTNFTVMRISLRRKNANSPHHRANALLENPDRDVSREEKITEEPLMDMDPTFIDAVEKVLSHSGESSGVASRNPSRAPSPTRHHRDRIPTNEGTSGFEIPRNRCKSMLLGALEQVAKNVSDDMAANQRSGKDVHREMKRNDMLTESTLREGVRKWFYEVDMLTP